MSVIDTIPSDPQTPAPIWNTVLRYGGITALALVVYSLLSYLMGVNPMAISTMAINFFVSLGIVVGMAAMAIKFQRDQLENGYIKYGRAFLVGFCTLAIGVFLSGFWNYILVNFIDPEYVNTLKEQFVNTWGENMPAEELDKALERFDHAKDIGENLKNGLIGAGIMGVIGGLIAAAIMRRNPPIN